MPNAYRLIILVVPSLFLLISSAAAENSADYIKGYVQAVLDRDFASSKVRVIKVDARQLVTLSSSTAGCVPTSERKRIEQSITKQQVVSSVEWSGVVECAAGDPPPTAAEEVVTETLPVADLFSPPLADQHEPRSSARYENYRAPSGSFNAAQVQLGDNFPIANFVRPEGEKYQFGLQGGISALFNLDANSKDLVNTDFLIGLPVSYQKGPLSGRARIFHQSSHLGDEFLLDNPEVERVNLSFEEVDVLLAYQWDWLRVYGGGGAILRSDPNLDPFTAQFGAEGRLEDIVSSFDLIGAVEFQGTQELDWNFSQHYLLGLGFNKYNERELRVMIGYYDGFSPNGQFFREDVNYWSLGLYYDL